MGAHNECRCRWERRWAQRAAAAAGSTSGDAAAAAVRCRSADRACPYEGPARSGEVEAATAGQARTVDVANVDLHRGLVLGLDQTVGGGALPRDVKVDVDALSVVHASGRHD